MKPAEVIKDVSGKIILENGYYQRTSVSFGKPFAKDKPQIRETTHRFTNKKSLFNSSFAERPK